MHGLCHAVRKGEGVRKAKIDHHQMIDVLLLFYSVVCAM